MLVTPLVEIDVLETIGQESDADKKSRQTLCTLWVCKTTWDLVAEWSISIAIITEMLRLPYHTRAVRL